MSSPLSQPTQVPRKQKRTRASKACLLCHRRKVRCNVSVVGNPCSNCSLDHEICIVPHRASKRGSRTKYLKPSNRHAEDEQPVPEPIEEVPSAENDGNTPRDTSPKETLPTHGPKRAHKLVRRSPEYRNDQPSNDSWRFLQDEQRLFTTTVPFSAYRFVDVGNLHKLPPEDINFLELKQCLRLPARPYMDEFLQQYFRYVHPFLPLIDESRFWAMYHPVDVRGMHDAKPTFSLIVLQAMLLTACSFVAPVTLQRLGYSFPRNARRAFFERARLLYNFDTEDSKLHIAQAALLLSYWTPSYEEASMSKPNSTWLRTAIENARFIGAHDHNSRFHSANETQGASYRSSLKRLWGCCITRDCTSAIALRRPCQIDRPHAPCPGGFSLSMADFEDEIIGSKEYDPPIKKQLIATFLAFGEMCMMLKDISVLLFPYDDFRPSNPTQQEQFESIQKIKLFRTLLNRWHRSSQRITRTYDSENQKYYHPSVTLFANLRRIYYFCTKIALANRQMLLSLDDSLSEGHHVSECHQEVEEATSAIGHCFETLAHLQLTRFLPVSVIPCIALPYALQTASSLDKHLEASSESQVFMQAMKTYESLYEGVEGLTNTINLIVGGKQLVQFPRDPCFTSTSQEPKILRDSEPFYHPNRYMRLVVTMDMTLSTGHMPGEHEFPKRLQENSNKDEACTEGADFSPVADETNQSLGKSRTHEHELDDMEFGTQPDSTGLSEMSSIEPNVSINDLLALDIALGLEHAEGMGIDMTGFPDLLDFPHHWGSCDD